MNAASVMHVITGLEVGGAERMLSNIALRTRYPTVVVSLKTEGSIGKELKAQDIPVHALNLSRNLSVFTGVSKLRKLVDQHQPAVIQSWLYAADLIAGYVAHSTKIPIVWNVRQSEIRWGQGQKHIPLNQRINAKLSTRWPSKIIFCGDVAYTRHMMIGYDPARGIVIPNGIDTEMFCPNPTARTQLRQKWNIDEGCYLIGMVGRYDPLKNHRRFLQVLARLKTDVDKPVHAVLIGRGVELANEELRSHIADLGLQDNCTLLGERDDISEAMNAFDLYLLTSDSEGWPNVLGEAMACGRCCVATDVGDVRQLMGDAGYAVSPTDDVSAFVNACRQVLALGQSQREQRGQAARDRIVDRFSLKESVRRYDEIYASYLGRR